MPNPLSEATRRMIAKRNANRPNFVSDRMAEAIETASWELCQVTLNSSKETTMDFSDALRALKAGERICRDGWNGRGMWLVLILPGGVGLDATFDAGEEGPLDMQPFIGMKTADNKMQPGWLASQADLLAEDWIIVL